jgi:hypothetical protein
MRDTLSRLSVSHRQGCIYGRHHCYPRRMPPGSTIVRRATRLGLVIEKTTEGEYRVLHAGNLVYSSKNKALADAHFEVLRDELQAATGEDPKARVRAEQAFRDILVVRGEATRRRTASENEKGGKGGRGGA